MYSGGGFIKIFAGRTGLPFAKRMCAYLGTQLGDAETIMFSEGNIFVRVNESIRDKDVYIVQPIARQPNDELVELLFWIDAFKRASADSVTAIIPYFSYAKGDKKDEPRVSIRARVCAECIELAGADRVITMDLHSPQVRAFSRSPSIIFTRSLCFASMCAEWGWWTTILSSYRRTPVLPSVRAS
jgi:ribose-phosphate pyrophosphokinase